MKTQRRKKKKSKVNQLVIELLKQLNVRSDGIPSGILSRLCDLAGTEIALVENELAAKIADLNKDAETRISKRLAETITLKSIGEAFVGTANPAQAPGDSIDGNVGGTSVGSKA